MKSKTKSPTLPAPTPTFVPIDRMAMRRAEDRYRRLRSHLGREGTILTRLGGVENMLGQVMR